jgi:hypothetical protein
MAEEDTSYEGQRPEGTTPERWEEIVATAIQGTLNFKAVTEEEGAALDKTPFGGAKAYWRKPI